MCIIDFLQLITKTEVNQNKLMFVMCQSINLIYVSSFIRFILVQIWIDTLDDSTFKIRLSRRLQIEWSHRNNRISFKLNPF